MNRDEEHFKGLRYGMVAGQLRSRGIKDERVLRSMERIPRHQFVLRADRFRAYEDGPLPIGYGQTISQPFIVAFMTECLDLAANHSILEIGTGCGYQAAVLASLGARLVSVERISELAEAAQERLTNLGFTNVTVIHGDGFKGHAPEAPYDRIMVTAAPRAVPPALLEQLAPEGKMVLPVGRSLMNQRLEIITKDKDGGVNVSTSIGVRFVPMV